MSELAIFNGLLIGWFVLAAVVFFLLFFIAAPYGRHLRRGWGYTLGNKPGWVLMEAPAPIILAVCFLLGGNNAKLLKCPMSLKSQFETVTRN